MKSKNPCITATVTEALERLPGPEGQRFATVFQHGSLLVEIYAPRGDLTLWVLFYGPEDGEHG